jgi:hypothetical protein
MSKQTHEAELVRGETYYLGNTRFERGKKVKVTQAQANALEEIAVDYITEMDRGEKKPIPRAKFESRRLRRGDYGRSTCEAFT